MTLPLSTAKTCRGLGQSGLDRLPLAASYKEALIRTCCHWLLTSINPSSKNPTQKKNSISQSPKFAAKMYTLTTTPTSILLLAVVVALAGTTMARDCDPIDPGNGCQNLIGGPTYCCG